MTPLGVSKLRVVALRDKNQRIALHEYSRLVTGDLLLGQYLTQICQVKGQFSGKIGLFQLYTPIAAYLW